MIHDPGLKKALSGLTSGKCQFAALWLMQQINGHSGIVMKDLHEHYAEIFEPELDGKTPVTIRGFDWYEDTVR